MDILSPHIHDGNIPAAPGVYKITCTVTKKIYIGSALDLHHRQVVHFRKLRQNKHHNRYLQRAFDKYGPDAFTFEVLEFVLPIFLTAREQYWFDKLKPFGRKGFNIAREAGSSLGVKHSPEQIERNRQRTLGRKASPETCERMSQSRLGKKRSPEAVENSRLGHLGHKVSPETREKLRQANLGKPNPMLGRKHTPEAIEKIIQAKRGKSNGNLGKKHKPEWIEKTRKTYIVTAPDGTEYIVHGILQFCREYKLDASSLVKVAKGKIKQYKGWKARYPSEEGSTWAL